MAGAQTKTWDDVDEEAQMTTKDKASNKAQEIKGEVEEKVGAATGNEDLERRGTSDQAKASTKQLGEKVKDTFLKIKDTITHHK
jgi:uncharacterized protein YjbJ (UPF0337 family)